MQGIFSGKVEVPELEDSIHKQWSGPFVALEWWDQTETLSPPFGVRIGYNPWNSFSNMKGPWVELSVKF